MAKAPHVASAELLEIYRRTSSGVEELFYKNADGTEKAVGGTGGGGNHAITHAEGGLDELIATVSPSTQAFGDAASLGANSLEASPALHKHAMMSDPVPPHVAAGDPHTQYALDSDLASYETVAAFNAHHARHDAGGADAMVADAAAGTASLRSLGSTATTAAAGNDSRLSDARTPTAHATTHNSGGSDVLAADAAAGTASLRTLNTTATTAAAGNHTSPAMSATVGGHVPTPPNNTTTFLRGDGTFAAATIANAKYDPGASYTLLDGEFRFYAKRQVISGANRVTLQGSSRELIL